jgi:hypothetical protein
MTGVAQGVWHCLESRRRTMRRELSTIPSGVKRQATSPERISPAARFVVAQFAAARIAVAPDVAPRFPHG